MSRQPSIIISFLSLVLLTGCLFTKGHFTADGSAFIWNKDPSGKYNAHNALQIEKASNWINLIKQIETLRTLQIEIFSKKWDDYSINDTGVFISNGNLFKGQEQVKYKSAKTMGYQIGISDTLLIKIIKDFDSLGLNRFYREERYFAFKTQTSLEGSRGYFYFIDTSLVKEKGDTLNLKNLPNYDNFRQALFDRFIIKNKFDNHWIEWEEVK